MSVCRYVALNPINLGLRPAGLGPSPTAFAPTFPAYAGLCGLQQTEAKCKATCYSTTCNIEGGIDSVNGASIYNYVAEVKKCPASV